MRTHVVSQQLHQLHVAALLPPQARLERLEKALAAWRLIRRRPTKASRITCQTASDHRERRCRYAHCSRCSSPVPGGSDLSARPASASPPQPARELKSSDCRHQENSALWATSYPQRFRELLRSVPPPAPAPASAHYDHARRAVDSGVAPA